MQKKGKKKLLTKNEIIYIISANSTKVRVVFGNNEPKNEEMKEPLVASGFALIERNARFHNRLKIVWALPVWVRLPPSAPYIDLSWFLVSNEKFFYAYIFKKYTQILFTY
jgi:hypothetical protein